MNQHRLKAVEDLNKINIEKQLLVDRIEQLELEKQTAVAKPQGTLSPHSLDLYLFLIWKAQNYTFGSYPRPDFTLVPVVVILTNLPS